MGEGVLDETALDAATGETPATAADPVYLDANATTPVAPAVLAAMLPYFTTEFGNPSSPYAAGGRAKAAVSAARAQVAALIGADEAEMVFTSGGTEGANAAIRAALEASPKRARAGDHRGRARRGALARRPAGIPRLHGAAHPGRADRRARHGGVRGRARPRRRGGVRDVGQQRDRHPVSGGGAGREGPLGRRAVPHRRGAGGGQAADRRRLDADRPAVVLRPQAARPQGGRRALCPPRPQASRR